jgi:hypothetical protein
MAVVTLVITLADTPQLGDKDEEAFAHMATEHLAQRGLLDKGDSVLCGRVKINVEHIEPPAQMPLHTMS